MVNKLWSNILWGQRSNFVGVPTDCPQRDERLGWMADAQVFWRTASYNMDLACILAQDCPRHARDTSGNADVQHLCARHRKRELRLWPRLERRRRYYSLDLVAADRRHQRHRSELGRHGEVPGSNRDCEPRRPMEESRAASRSATGSRPKAEPTRSLSPLLRGLTI